MVNDTWADYEHLAALSDEELCACVRAGNRLAEEVLAARYHRLVRTLSTTPIFALIIWRLCFRKLSAS